MAPHDQVDLHPARRRTIERADHPHIVYAVHLQDDPAALAQRDLAIDQPQQLAPHVAWRNKQMSVALLGGKPGQEMEQVYYIAANGWRAREQPDVRVNLCSALVVVAGADVAVGSNRIAIITDHER